MNTYLSIINSQIHNFIRFFGHSISLSHSFYWSEAIFNFVSPQMRFHHFFFRDHHMPSSIRVHFLSFEIRRYFCASFFSIRQFYTRYIYDCHLQCNAKLLDTRRLKCLDRLLSSILFFFHFDDAVCRLKIYTHFQYKRFGYVQH